MSRRLLKLESFTFYHQVALDGLYIPTGNDLTSYFPSAANSTSVVMFGYFRKPLTVLVNGFPLTEKVSSVTHPLTKLTF